MCRLCFRILSGAKLTVRRDSNNHLLLKGNNILIQPGSTFILPIRVEKEGTLLKWKFYTDTYDIVSHFGLFENGKLTRMKVDSEVYVGNGRYHLSVKVDKKGVYGIEWDNTASWIRDKKVSYIVEEFLPDPTVDEKIQLNK